MRTKKLTMLSLLLATSLVIGFFESLLPVFSVLPGGKVGLANSVTMLVFCLFSFPEALVFGIMRSLLSAVLYSGFSAFFYSAAGTALSIFAMYMFGKTFKKSVSEIGLSVLGAVFFNIGQLTVACAVLETAEIFRYFPVLGVVSVFAGALTGYIAQTVLRYLSKQT